MNEQKINEIPEGFKITEIDPLPEEWNEKPPSINEIPEGVFVIQSDAAFKNGITGAAITIKTKNKEYTSQTYSAKSEGPIHSELTSIKKGLQRIKMIKKTRRRIVVYNDNLYANYFLNDIWVAQKLYITNTLADIAKLVEILNVQVVFIWVKGQYNKKVDKLALKKRKEEEKRKEKQIKKRVMKVEEAIIKGRDIGIILRDGEYFAMPKRNGYPPGYQVSLAPPSCECPWWKHNWASKPDYIQKARALPCKHICALAEYQELDIFEIFDKQIRRRN